MKDHGLTLPCPSLKIHGLKKGIVIPGLLGVLSSPTENLNDNGQGGSVKVTVYNLG